MICYIIDHYKNFFAMSNIINKFCWIAEILNLEIVYHYCFLLHYLLLNSEESFLELLFFFVNEVYTSIFHNVIKKVN